MISRTRLTGTFKVYVEDDVDLNKVTAGTKNGGSASRNFSEVRGTSTKSVSGNNAAGALNRSVFESVASGLKAYPNPVAGHVIVTSGSPIVAGAPVMLFDATVKRQPLKMVSAWSTYAVTLDLSPLVGGVYTIQL